MSLIQIEWHPGRRQLHVFGVSGLLASIVAGVVLHWIWGVALVWSLVILAAGAVLFLCSRISLRATRVLYLGLTIPMLPVGYLVSFLLLAGFYFLVLTPVAVVFRLIGRDPLRRACRGRDTHAFRAQRTSHGRSERGPDGLATRGRDALATSYWVPHKPSEETERYLHPF
jgi:hypothetical protein